MPTIGIVLWDFELMISDFRDACIDNYDNDARVSDKRSSLYFCTDSLEALIVYFFDDLRGCCMKQHIKMWNYLYIIFFCDGDWCNLPYEYIPLHWAQTFWFSADLKDKKGKLERVKCARIWRSIFFFDLILMPSMWQFLKYTHNQSKLQNRLLEAKKQKFSSLEYFQYLDSICVEH